MRVGIDAHMLGSQETGNETYCRGLLEGLEQLGDGNDYLVYMSGAEQRRQESEANVARKRLERDGDVWRLTVGFAGLSRADKLDLLHVTYNVPLFTRCPVVVSVHDISYRHFPEFFSKRDLRLLNTYVPYSVRASRHVLTLSESAANDISSVYGVDREKISVIPLAARAPFTRSFSPAAIGEVLAQHNLSQPYILAVGNLQPRKNLIRLVEAFAGMDPTFGDLRLAIVGKAQWKGSEVVERVRALGLSDRVIFTGYVSDDELACLYRAATALVYPSLYEGFGLPILEAMSCGAPVICSNTSSMPEVAGEAAVLVDPLDVDALRNCIVHVAGSSAVQRDLRALGLARAAEFSWVNTARLTAQVYERCA